MNIFINILVAIICLLFGYILGSIPTSVIIGKVFYHQDPREFGSKNAGGTNAGRLWGKKVGLTVIILDMLKTILPLWIAWAILVFVPFNNGQALCPRIEVSSLNGVNLDYVIGWPVYWLTALGCIFGHCFPIFANFKGGKGVSCFMGIILTSTWMFGFIPGLLFLLILKIKKYVSLSSILTSIISSLISWIFSILCLANVIPQNLFWLPMYGPNLVPGWICSIVLTLMSFLIVIRHKGNISRLKDGTEKKIKWMK